MATIGNSATVTVIILNLLINRSYSFAAVAAVLTAVAASAWGYLFYQSWQMQNLPMSAMWMPPNRIWEWSVMDFWLVFSMWAVMMAAMMLPSAVPMIKAFHQVANAREPSTAFAHSTIFALAYLSVWLVFSAGLTVAQWQLHGLNWLTPMMANGNLLLAGLIFILAGVYQFTPIKNQCLHYCRSTVGFLMNHWSDGSGGAYRLGLLHGGYCLGCCWAQMLIMFAVGVMNVAAMVLLTVFMLLEKTRPPNSRFIGYCAGVVACGWGLILVVQTSI